MTEGTTLFQVFIDYDNLLPAHRISGILNVVTNALMQIPHDFEVARANCEVRVYGGWYEGTEFTRKAQDVSVEIQRDFPKIMKFPNANGSDTLVSVKAQLAIALLQEPGHSMFHTYRKKGKPSNIRIEDPSGLGCCDRECLLLLMKQLLRTGRCPKSGCKISKSDLVYRHEQKLVDTMLTCDLICASDRGTPLIVLVSGDDDFIPPLRTISLRGTTAIRFHTQPNAQRTTFPHGGTPLIEMEL